MELLIHHGDMQGSIYSETLLRATLNLHSHICIRELAYLGQFDRQIYF